MLEDLESHADIVRLTDRLLKEAEVDAFMLALVMPAIAQPAHWSLSWEERTAALAQRSLVVRCRCQGFDPVEENNQ